MAVARWSYCQEPNTQMVEDGIEIASHMEELANRMRGSAGWPSASINQEMVDISRCLSSPKYGGTGSVCQDMGLLACPCLKLLLIRAFLLIFW